MTVAALFTAGLVLLVSMRPADGEHIVLAVEREIPHPLTDLREGLRFVVRTPWLRWTLLFASTWVFVALGPIDVLLPFIARERFAHGGSRCTASCSPPSGSAAHSARWWCPRGCCRGATSR